MTKDIKQLHAKILELQGFVSFYDGDLYEINETGGGYMVDVYEISDEGLLMDDVDARLMRPVDGGLCTGSAMDAIEFMMEVEV